MFLNTDSQKLFSKPSKKSVPIHLITKADLASTKNELSKQACNWAKNSGFKANSGQICLVSDEKGGLSEVLFGMGSGTGEGKAMAHGVLARKLPQGSFHIAGERENAALDQLAWAMGGYSFDVYRDGPKARATLGTKVDKEAAILAQSVFFTRDLINTPASDMGPDALEKAFRKLAKHHQANCTVIKGDMLIKKNFPMVHAVGRASSQAPRVLDMTWGDKKHPKVTLVGKGVTFDTGGLNIKPGSSMSLMKKDMGGAANVMGLAHAIMASKLPVRLRVIVGAVENAISGNAFRPGDVLNSRKGITVEIGNTDAEGRLVLGDCLALGDEDKPDLMIDMATLTGAARVALGPDLPPFYTDDDGLAAGLSQCSTAVNDPLWRMPLWQPYQSMLSSKIADVNHISSGGFAGSVTAALFLSRFVDQAKSWCHFDIFGWTPAQKPWAPIGGEAQGIRALFEFLRNHPLR